MTSEDQTGEFDMIEELTAYLDGELDEASVQRVEKRLADDAEYLAEMRSLQQTWDMLDQVPVTEPNRSFTKTTMELVVGQAQRESKRQFSWFWPARFLAGLVLFSALFALGFQLVRTTQTHPDRVLLEHLPVIENHERFASVDMDLDFVRQMMTMGLFSQDSLQGLEGEALNGSETDPTIDRASGLSQEDVFASSATLEQRLEWVQRLDLDAKEDLKRKLDSFLELSEQAQLQRIEFGNELAQDPEATELMSVIREYCNWLKIQDVGLRYRILDQPVEQRLASIRAQREQEARRQFGKVADNLPSQEDAEYLFDWFQGAINARASQIREYFPEAVLENRKALQLGPIPSRILTSLSRKAQLNQLVDYLIDIDQEYVEAMLFEDSSLDLLYLVLTPEAKRMLNDQPDSERRALLLSWVKSVNRAYYNVSQDRLRRFAESLPQEEKDRLDQLSSSNYQARVRQLYLQRKGPGRDPYFDWRRLLNAESPFEQR